MNNPNSALDRVQPKLTKIRAGLSLTAGLLLLGFGTVAQAAINNWTGTATDRDWFNPANWTLGIPDATSDVLFDNVDTQADFATNNFLDQNLTIGSLTYSNVSYTSFAASGPYFSHNTEIRSGHTLTVTNGITVGVSSTAAAKNFTGNVFTHATISGADGTLAVTGGNIRVGYQSSGTATTTFTLYGLLDMRELGTFIHNAPRNIFGIASQPQRRQSGEVYLAKNNFLTTSNIYIGLGITGAGTSPAKIHLGQSNVFNAGTILIGQDTQGSMDFIEGLSNPTLKLRGTNGSSGVANVYMGATFGASSVWGRGTNDLTDGIVDAVITNLFIGYHAGDTSGSSQITRAGLLIGPSPSNNFVVQNLTIGSNPGGPTVTATSQCFGFLDMQGGTFSVAGTAVIGSARNAGSGTGTLNLQGGTFTAGSVQLGVSISNGTTDGYVNLSGGSLRIAGNMTMGLVTFFSAGSACGVTNATLGVGGRIGASTNYLSRLTLDQATLELGLGGGANVGAYVENFVVESPSTIVITSTNLALGQFPIIAYQSFLGASGFAGLSLSLPPGVSATLVDNSANQSVDLLVTVVPSAAATPVLTGCILVSPGVLKVIGSGTPNQPYYAYSSTNIALPMAQWTPLGNVNADGTGVIQFLDDTTTDEGRFYRLGR